MCFARVGNTAALSWGAVAGARLYRVRVKGSDGRLDTFFASRGRRSETLPNVLPWESFAATIVPVGGPPALLAGPATTVRLAAVKPKPAAKPHRRGHGR